MSEFLTVKDAAQKTGKSSSSIRRVIYPILKDDSHPDRQHVRPSPEEARELRLKGENFPWRLSQELLDREVASKPVATAEGNTGGGGDEAMLHEVNAMLREQLQIAQQQLQVKDHQIADLSEITKSLNERLREGNILMGSLQKQLGTASSGGHVTEAKPAPRPQPVKQPIAKKPKPKKGFWGHMFG
jgi:hypothetical protein